MKLKIINLTLDRPSRLAKTTIHINKSGAITFSKGVVSALGLAPGSVMEFAQDESRPKDFYFFLSSSPNGYVLRGKKSTTALCFNSVGFFQVLNDALNLGDESISLPVSITPLEVADCPPLYAILTSAAKQ